MSRLAWCTCKSHCLEFNLETQSYEGEGQLIPKSTASSHRVDDRLSQTLDNLTANVAARVLRYSPPPDASEEVVHSSADGHSFVLETEILRRCTWTLGDRSLVFAVDPFPSLEYQYPAADKTHVCNHGPYALLPGDIANVAYLENESRLCEILMELNRRHPIERWELMLAKVHEGLTIMRRHKEMEWNRQRTWSIARSHGYGVVDTSEPAHAFPSSLSTTLNSNIRPLFRNLDPSRPGHLHFLLDYPHPPFILSDTTEGNYGYDSRYSKHTTGVGRTA